MCNKNCKLDRIKFIGTLYGYCRNYKVLYDQLSKFRSDDIVQVMTHPGFYFSIIPHNSNFSNYDRVEEIKSLKRLKKVLKKENFKYINYVDWRDLNE